MPKTIAELLAAEAKELTFQELPPEVVHQAKRSLLDTLGVGFGGYLSEPSRIMQKLTHQVSGMGESTIWGSGLKTSCLNATLINGVMARFLDFTDRAFLTKDTLYHAGHHGECIPSILAVAERQQSSGQDVIVAIVLAYEMMNKIFGSVPKYDAVLDVQGLAHETMRTPCAMALVLGRMLGLHEEQLAHALSLAGCFNFDLGITNWCEEEVGMARNLRFPYGAYHGIMGAFLAQSGFKGPLNVFEGRHGLAEVVTGGKMDLEKLRQPRKEWTILNTWIKRFATGGNMQGALEATLTSVKKHDIKPEDVKEVRIKTTSVTYMILCNPETRRVSTNTYTADHSAYYCTAMTILDRAVGPEQISEERLRDPKVQEIANKIFIEPDPKYDAISAGGSSGPAFAEIITNQGQKYSCEVIHPKGHPKNPMSDVDLAEKFHSMAKKFMDEKQIKQITDTIHNLEKLDDISHLAKLLVFPKQNNGK